MVARQQTGGSTPAFRRQQDNQSTSLSNETNYNSGRHHGLPKTNAKRLARGLGWFSLGLGMTELLAPKFIARISGVPERRTDVIRLYGLREIAAGIGIFAQKNPVEAMWSRVAGDVLDLTSLTLACTAPDAKKKGESPSPPRMSPR